MEITNVNGNVYYAPDGFAALCEQVFAAAIIKALN